MTSGERSSRATALRSVASLDGTPIAIFTSGTGPPLILVHGAAADHTTFRVVGPVFAERYTVHAMDRRGRGASGDTLPYSVEREFEDVAAVAGAIAADAGQPVDVVGHSYGGRCALGAALLTDTIRRVVSYEGAPAPPDKRYGDVDILADLEALDAAGRPDDLLATFMERVVGMDAAALARYRADPVWPLRVAAAHTIPRELAAEGRSAAAGLESLGAIRQPVLQLLGGESRPEFGAATRALDARLADGRIVTMTGAKHAAHHTHPVELARAVAEFLEAPPSR
ncbi:MAG TPA: alpha/beta hydrolase [Candidatus Limnocylindrales bacterium]|nr:alpha/beta hydrolase [Candidatus Limnocylindrales bacterium]